MAERQPHRLVFAACRPPFPLDNGARIRAFQLMSGLARSFDVAFVTQEQVEDGPGNWQSRYAELLEGVSVISVPLPSRSKRADQAASLLRRESWAVGRYRNPTFTAALAYTIAAHKPRLVHLDDFAVATQAPISQAVRVYSAHNVEQAIVRLQARRGRAPRRYFNAVEGRKISVEERRVWRQMDLCLAVSPLDAEMMRAGGAARVELCPNGVAPVARLPLRPLRSGEPLRLLFVGSGDYAPYEHGLAWLVREVLPRVAAVTTVAFDVVGAPPARPLAAPGVRYLGRVASVEPHYEAAHVVVVPVFEGSGTRLKIIEAAAYGRPVVSTRLGAEGLPLRAGTHYLQADDAETFAAAVLEIERRWREPGSGELERMVRDAAAAVQPLTWPRIVDDLAELYRTEIERRARTLRGASAATIGATPRPLRRAQPVAPGALLIINADDWGLDEMTTAAIRSCLEAGAVTSVSAMVFMAGSEHAATLAPATQGTAGLHLNLTEPFTAAGIAEDVRERQARIAAYFAGPSWRRWGVNARLFGEIELAIADQLAEFRRLYAREPSHIDGHEHIHQSLGVLAARTLPAATKMRPSFTYPAGEKSRPNRCVRAVVNAAMRARFVTPRYFFSIRDMHPLLGGRGIDEKLALAGGSAVEVMCHPGWEDERAILRDPDWLELIRERRLGSYEQLAAQRSGRWRT
jgi:predicted glycoside hydrolase/deacetylase ChbG (UPF0249 family)/glycosyltransferase involved in cell wall biosynthesis